MPKKIAALAAALLACCWALPVAAQDAVAQFYRGKTVTIVVGSSAGGGYDTYARLMARFLQQAHARQSDRRRRTCREPAAI